MDHKKDGKSPLLVVIISSRGIARSFAFAQSRIQKCEDRGAQMKRYILVAMFLAAGFRQRRKRMRSLQEKIW